MKVLGGSNEGSEFLSQGKEKRIGSLVFGAHPNSKDENQPVGERNIYPSSYTSRQALELGGLKETEGYLGS